MPSRIRASPTARASSERDTIGSMSGTGPWPDVDGTRMWGTTGAPGALVVANRLVVRGLVRRCRGGHGPSPVRRDGLVTQSNRSARIISISPPSGMKVIIPIPFVYVCVAMEDTTGHPFATAAASGALMVIAA